MTEQFEAGAGTTRSAGGCHARRSPVRPSQTRRRVCNATRRRSARIHPAVPEKAIKVKAGRPAACAAQRARCGVSHKRVRPMVGGREEQTHSSAAQHRSRRKQAARPSACHARRRAGNSRVQPRSHAIQHASTVHFAAGRQQGGEGRQPGRRSGKQCATCVSTVMPRAHGRAGGNAAAQ